MCDERYKELRDEFCTPSFRDRMVQKLGSSCVNCGTSNEEQPIEYHHIVPLILGGTNRFTNIVPLCRCCHHLVHGAKNVSKINRDKPGGFGGRPKFKPADDYKETLDKFIRGTIGKSECQKLIGIKSRGTKLNDFDFYHDYLEYLGIIYMRNMVDAIRIEDCPETRIVSYVVFSDGTRLDYTKSGEVIKSRDMATVIRCQEKKRKKRTRIYTIV